MDAKSAKQELDSQLSFRKALKINKFKNQEFLDQVSSRLHRSTLTQEESIIKDFRKKRRDDDNDDDSEE